jgi:MOSC domain-containing protein
MDVTLEQLDAALDEIRSAPRETGTIELIAVRPTSGERRLLDDAVLDVTQGLVGDNWTVRKARTADGKPDPDTQITLMSIRALRAITSDRDEWPKAGDQLYVDFDVSAANLPVGTRLGAGTAELVITDKPHTGCVKFSARFGSVALRWVNTPVGRELNLRGIYARVVTSGTLRRGDAIKKL